MPISVAASVAPNTFVVTLPTATADGVYTLRVTDGVLDRSGNAVVPVEATFRLDTAAPAVVGVSPSGTIAAAVTFFDVTFGEPVSWTGAAVTLAGPTGAVGVTGVSQPSATTLRFAVPATDASGEFTVSVPTGAVVDAAGNQDSAGGTFTQTLAPPTRDLGLSFATNTVTEGQSLTATVTRTGPTDTPLTVALSAANGNQIGVPATVTIPAGQSSVTFAVTTVDDTSIEKPESVGITATAAGLTAASATLRVLDTSGPDLGIAGVGGLIVPDTARGGDRISVAYRVTNTGRSTATGPWTDELYLSSDQTLDATDTRIGDPFRFDANGSVPSGLYYERTVPVTLPNVVGTYYVIARTDALNELAEARESNNLRVSGPLLVSAGETARVQAAKEIYATGEGVQFTGTATRASGGPAGFTVVSILVRNGEFKRTIAALTDEGGAFRATFTPLSGESGAYTVAACAAGETDPPAQDAFTIVGLKATTPAAAVSVTENDTLTVAVSLTNPTGVPLTGITVTVTGLPPGVTATITGDTTLTANGTGTLQLALTAGDMTATTTANAKVRLTTAEGATVEIPCP